MSYDEIIDLRSDTVTRPTPAMLEAMMNAPVGDDVYGEDPTVNELQQRVAKIFGHEAGLFCPSGTMTNQIAIRCLTRPQDEVICHRLSHIYNYEGGGIASNSLCSVRLIHSPDGTISPQDVEDNLNPQDSHFPRTALVALENTINKAGGVIFPPQLMAATTQTARKLGLSLHLDGARIFNALVETSQNPAEIGRQFDTVSVCLSKGLGAPAGSVLVGSKELIAKAHRFRKVMGGGMRQAGILAAAGLYALDNHISLLSADHARAKELATVLRSMSWVESVIPPQTNIVIFGVENAEVFVAKARNKGLLCNAFGKRSVRFVTHLNFDNQQLERSISILKSF